MTAATSSSVRYADMNVRALDTWGAVRPWKLRKSDLARFLLLLGRMKTQLDMKALKGERGSVMMEYVIVLCGIGVALMVFMNREFFDYRNGFGPLGQGVVAFYQRTLGGLSLPVP